MSKIILHALAAVGVVAFCISLGYLCSEEKPCQTCASVHQAMPTDATSDAAGPSGSQAASISATASAPSTSASRSPLDSPRKPVENQPMPAPMYDALTKHFSQYETARLVSLYAEVHNKVPVDVPPDFLERMPPAEVSWADVRTRAKDILGEDGFKILMAEASPPEGVKDNTPEMVQYVLSKPPLGWFYNLKE